MAGEVCQFYLENRCRFGDQCRNLHPPVEDPEVQTVSPTPEEQDDVIRKDSPIKAKTRERKVRARMRMRSAADVIHRIRWDPAVNSADFGVVYLDRFTGLVPMALDEFAAAGCADSAGDVWIPQHRIRQIYYRQSVVWDKENKLDYVFGSTGYDGSIVDYIRYVNDQSEPTAATIQ